MNKNFAVTNMKCQGCVNNVSKALDSLEGIKDYSVNLASKEVSIDTEVADEIIIGAIKKAGYDAKAIA
ncbi:MAG TPA: heavy metal-associated domain-containing protein [Tetragenococcus sp.]|nr:heavy metal-associated domain-containing protein [Tetragenococcus sp.]